MKNLWIVTKNELIRYFISPLAYVYLVAFLLLNGSFAIYFGNFFDRGQASLLAMFAYQPWLYLLFLPGISMRLWSEEFRTKTIVQIMTMPVSTANLVWGKFLASWIFAALALILTFPFWITVNLLGSPDNSVIAVSYLGSWILAGCMLAISQTMSALTKNQVIALVLAVIANLMFMLSGLEYILAFFRLFAPLSIVDMIASFSFTTHFFTISQGLVEARDLIFFTSIILLFNFTTVIIVSFKTAGTASFLKSTSRNYYLTVFLLLLISFIGLNLIANNLTRSIQHDFTAEKIFTLTENTKQVLKNLPEAVTVKLYYTPELGRRNPSFRLMFDQVRILLKQYANLADGKLDYAIYNPQPFSEAEDHAITRGLKAIPLIDNSQAAYFGLTVSNSVDDFSVIPFLALERENLLEQDLTEAIYRLNHKKRTIGIISTLPVFDTVIENVATSRWEIINQLEKFYNVKSVSKAEEISDKLDALVIIHPRDFSQDMITAVRNYSYAGGKVLVFVDVATDSSRIFAPVTEDFKPSDLGGLDKSWGFQFNKNIVIADLDNSLTIQVGADSKNPDYTQDLLQFYLNYNDINHIFPETYNLKKMLVSSASVISPVDDADVLFLPLLKSSINSATVNAEWAQKSQDPNALLRNFKKDKFTKIIAAHIISKSAARPFDVIVVADTDMLYDSFWAKSIPMQDGNLIVPIFDNANFVLNSLETLIGGDNLIGLRGKSAKTRKFDRIENLRKQAQQDFKIKEQEILDRIDHTKEGLKEIWGKKSFEGRDTFTPDELSIIANIRKKLDSQRLELRDIRENLNTEIKQIDTLVKFYNIYAIPLLILLGLMAYALLTRRGKNPDKGSIPFYNRQILYLTLGAFALLGLGIAAVYFGNRQEIDSYEGKPFFPKLAEQINLVDKITLTGHDKTLRFYKEDNLWKLEGAPHLLVLQDRMRSFLSALLEARYYEKKSDKAENLSKFGLQPVTADGSPNIRVDLQNAEGRSLQSFEVGKYDIEIGRGTRAAYIKFDNQFQVWLAAIELIDLSTNQKEWTFSRLWDLRFGRFLSFNHITNVDTLANLAKYMLNTEILSAEDKLENPQELFVIDLQVEGNEKIKLSFLQKESKYFVTYDFASTPKNPELKNFAAYMSGNFYEISKTAMEKIKNVVEPQIPDRGTKK